MNTIHRMMTMTTMISMTNKLPIPTHPATDQLRPPHCLLSPGAPRRPLLQLVKWCKQRSTHQRRRPAHKILHFFITNHSKRSDITIIHCPTSHMLVDFFTKPLQGSLFRKFRAVLLGQEHISTLRDPSRPLSAKERVETENLSISPG
jgi:hypothetical protein